MACSGSSPNFTAASASQADIQACVNIVTAGTPSTITVPAGTAAFGTTPVTIPATACVTINGGGAVTLTSPTGFVVNQGTTCSSRVTGFTFTGGSSGPPSTATNIIVNGNTVASRIDNNTFTATGTQIFIVIASIGSAGQSYPTLIDHNTFNCGYTVNNACEAIHNQGAVNSGSQVGWTNNVTPGGPNMVFIEDNTFTQTGGNGGNQISAVEQFYGSQTVIRHNTFNNSTQVDAHGTPALTGARWWEIYNNQFNQNSFSVPDSMQLRGGTGVVFNNVSDGTSTNSTPCGSSTPCFIDIFNENGASGTWPNEWQPGSGINGNTNSHNSCPGPLNSAPIYLWNNTNLPVGVGGGVAGTVLINRDYFVSATQPATMSWQEKSGDTCSTTYTYSPYVYPHPLQGSLIPSNRSIDWTKAGIPGGIPSANWPICQTIPPSGGADDSATIQAALNSCASGSVVLLTAGTYTLHRATTVCPGKSDDGAGGVYESGLCVTDKSIVLRGAGPQSTILNYGDGANIISIGQTYLSHSSITFTPITSAASQGATTITVGTIPSGVVVNSFIVVSQTNPLDTDGNPLVQVGGYGGSCSYCGHDLPNNCMDQITQVTAINGTTLTLADPLYYNYNNSPVMYHLPMVQSAGVENLRVVGTVSSGTALTYKNINMEACAFCWVHNVESDFAVDVSNFYGSDVYAGEFSNNYAYEAFNHNAGGDYSMFLQFRASRMLIQNNIIRKARHSLPVQGTSGNVYAYNYCIDAYEGENHNFLAETQLHAPQPYMLLHEGTVASNAEYGDFAHGSSNTNTMFRSYMNMTSTNPDTGTPMTGGLIALNIAYYSNYANIIGNALGNYTGGCKASTYETDASTTKVNGVIWQLGYFDDGSGGTPNQTLSNKVGQTLLRGGNWDCVSNTTVWSNNIPAGSPSQSSYLAQQQMPNSLVFSSPPSYFTATGAVWPPIDPAATTKVNPIPAQICYNAPGGPATSAGGNFNPTACYTPATGTGAVTFAPATGVGLGNVIVNNPVMVVEHLQNSGTGTLNITSITVGGTNASMFTRYTTCGATLAAGNTCEIAVKFIPTSVGAKSATISVVDNATGSPHTFNVTGTGITGTIPALDQYGGTVASPCANITGRFHVEQVGLKWTYCTPLGNSFYLRGVYLVSDGSSTPYLTKITAKYGNTATWATAQLNRITSWGFNSAYYGSGANVQPFATDPSYPLDANGLHSIPTKTPTIFQLRAGYYGMRNPAFVTSPQFPNGKMLPVGGEVKNMAIGWSPVYNAPGGASNFVPPTGEADYFDPNLVTFSNNLLVSQSPSQRSSPYSDYILGYSYDDGDQTFGMGAGPDFPTIPPGHNNPHLAWLAATMAPTQVVSNLYPTIYTNTQVYTKQAWANYLQAKYTTIASLNTAWGSNYTTFGTTGTTITGEAVGTGNGSTTTFTHTLAGLVPAPFSVQILVNGVLFGGDLGKTATGTLYGISAQGPPPVVSMSGSIVYATGALSVTFVTAPASGAAITVNYIQNGWKTGTGVLDEDARVSHQAWLSGDPFLLSGVNANTLTDFNAFLTQLASHYLGVGRTAINAAFPGYLFLGPDSLGTWQCPPYRQVLQAVPGVVDVYVGPETTSVGDPNYQAKLDFIYTWAGNIPQYNAAYLHANPDSPFSANPLSNDYPTQAARGQAYASLLLSTQNSTYTANGVSPFIALNHFDFLDITVEQTNWGLVSLLDNAYDGHETTTATVSCSSPIQAYTCGGEAANYGNYICFVKAANLGQSTASCTGSGTSSLALTPTSFNFGTVPVGSNTQPSVFTLTNSGTGSANITSISFTGINLTDFSQTNTCGSVLAANSNCTTSVVFAPSLSGNETATLTIVDTDSTSPQTSVLTGAGIITDSFSGTTSFVLNMTSPWRITRY